MTSYLISYMLPKIAQNGKNNDLRKDIHVIADVSNVSCGNIFLCFTINTTELVLCNYFHKAGNYY